MGVNVVAYYTPEDEDKMCSDRNKPPFAAVAKSAAEVGWPRHVFKLLKGGGASFDKLRGVDL